MYSRDNLPETIKDVAYVIIFYKYADFGTHWITLYNSNTEIIYFNSFGVENAPKEIQKIFGHKNIKIDIFRVQENNSIMFRYFWIGFIDFTLAGKTLIRYTSLFPPYDFEKIIM